MEHFLSIESCSKHCVILTWIHITVYILNRNLAWPSIKHRTLGEAKPGHSVYGVYIMYTCMPYIIKVTLSIGLCTFWLSMKVNRQPSKSAM